MTRLTTVIGRAIEFLCQGRNVHGLWSDFLLPTGESDGWVTGYTGSVLAGCGSESAQTVCRDVWRIFGADRVFSGHGGWAFNKWSPEDADSTSWGIRFAIKLGLGEKFRVDIARKFLSAHICPTGGVSTFILEDKVRKFLGRRTEGTVTGWMEPHVCVTAAAAGIPGFGTPLIPWLVKQQQTEGFWEGYWWSDPEYCTAVAVEAVAMHGYPENSTNICHAQEWIRSSLGSRDCITNPDFPEGSPFATSLALRVLLAGQSFPEDEGNCRNLLAWLLEHQRADGSWQPSARLRVPDAAISGPDKLRDRIDRRDHQWEVSSIDQHAVFSTATVLDALIKATQAGQLHTINASKDLKFTQKPDGDETFHDSDPGANPIL